jgi:hypothetical protein
MITHVKAVTTAYRPDIAILGEGLAATAPQVEALLLIANDGAPWFCQLPANVALVRHSDERSRPVRRTFLPMIG